MITLLIADDQALVRGALAALLNLEKDLQVVAEVGSGTEIVAAALKAHVDVALIDIEMPGMDGITATQALTDALPTCATIIVTTFGRPGYLKRAVAAGAKGFLVKDTPPHIYLLTPSVEYTADSAPLTRTWPSNHSSCLTIPSRRGKWTSAVRL